MAAMEGKFNSWDEFKEFTGRYARLPYARHESFIFRGQREWSWSLDSTLDRWLAAHRRPAESRVAETESLLKAFREQLQLIDHPAAKFDSPKLLRFARHHGLPTPLIDWTRSPYIAAYFALAEDGSSEDAALWVIDRDIFLTVDARDAELPEPDFDVSAREATQQSVFVKLTGQASDLEALLQGGLWKLRIPRRCRCEALSDLNAMGISATALFRDPQNAATGVMLARTLQWEADVNSL